MLTHSFEDLAQTFRILMESDLKFNKLINIDRAEAVGTLETAINAKLNAFHNLYDLINKEVNNSLDWYATPQLCIILIIRNARHHNKANRIRSIYNYHTQTAINPSDKNTYLYVDFPAPPEEEGGDCFDIPLSWNDLDIFLSLPRSESRLRRGCKKLVRDYLQADKFEKEAEKHGLLKKDIFFNFVPLSLNAGIATCPDLKGRVSCNSIESKSFYNLFKTIGSAITNQHEYNLLEFYLPE